MAGVGNTCKPVLDQAHIRNVVLDTTDILIAHLDRSFTILYVNRAYSQAARHSIDDLVGRHYFDIFPLEANRRHFQQVLDTGKPVYLHAEPYQDDGRPQDRKYYRDWSILPCCDDSGEVIGITLSGTEVERRVDDRADHLRIQDSLEHLYESRQLLSFRGELDSQRIVDASRGLAELLGYPDRASLIGRPIREIIVDEQTHDGLHDLISEKRFLPDVETQFRRSDGSLVWIEATAWVTRNDNTVNVVVRDITERHRERQELKQRERLYRQIFERNSAVKLLIDPADGRIVDANSAACSFYGYSREEILNLRITDINVWPPEEVAEEMARANTSERTYFRFPHRLADGSIRQVEVYSGPVEIDGRPMLHSIIHDISDRIEAERSLADSERRFRDFVEGTDDLVVQVDTEGRFMYVNDSSHHFFGRRPSELIGESSFDYIHETDRERTIKAFTYWVNNQIRSASIQNRQVNGRGQAIHVSWHVNLSYDPDGKLVGVNGIARDITRLKEIEEALYAAQKEFRAIADYTCNWEYWQDNDGNLLWVNPSVTELTGYSVRECLSMPGYPLPMVHDDDRERVAEALANVTASDLEFRLVRKDGAMRWMSVSWQPIQLDDSYAGIRASVRDVTESKAMEQKLREDKLLFEEVERVGEIGWWYLDVATGRLFWSDQYYKLYRLYDQKDTIEPSHEKFLSMLHPDDRERMEKLVAQSTVDDHVKAVDFRIIRGDGSIGYMRGSAKVLHNDLGEPQRIIGVNYDMTSRVEMEQQLLDHEFVQQEIARVINLGWFFHDLGDGEIYWSDQLYAVFGVDKSEFTPDYKSLFEFIHPDDRQAMKTQFDRLFTEQVMISNEYRIVHKNGDVRTVLGFARMLKNPAGDPMRVVGAVLDITERKRYQEEIAKAQKLQSLGAVAGGIAHEFNNLLTGVLGNIAMAVGELNVDSEAYTMLREAERIAERTRELTSQLLTFSTGGKPVVRDVDLASLVANCVPLLLKRSNCIACYDLPDDLPMVRGDRIQLSQVINNLVLNAREAMQSSGGAIRLIGDVATVQGRNDLSLNPGTYVRLRIIDHGSGIDDAVRGHIFDPFFTTREQHHGLGLAAAYSIVRNHDGHLALEQTSPSGSTFVLYLPVSQAADQTTGADASPAEEPGTVRILVMDDEEPLRRLAAKILERRGCVVDTVADGSAAIELVKKQHGAACHYDIAILDLSVPGDIGGEKALAGIRQICPGIKAIVCSGYAEDPVMANHAAYGFNAVLGKPYLPKELDAVVDSLLER